MEEFLYHFHTAKAEGNDALKNENYLEAIECYDKAFQYIYGFAAFRVVPTLDISDEFAKIFSNQSLAYLKIGDLQIAIDCAFQCINHNPLWWKGYWRLVKAFEATNEKKHEQLHFLLTGLQFVQENVEGFEEKRTNFVLSIVKLSFELRKRDYQYCKVSKRVWSNVIFKLSLQNCWQVIHLLMLGGGNKYRENSGGMATGCNMSRINFKFLIRYNDTSLRQWGVLLIIELIKHGADIKWLCLDEKSSTPLHSALHLCVIAGKVDLLKLLFEKYIKLPEDRNQVNSKGQTIFHVLSKEFDLNSTQTQFLETVVRLLINYGINLLIKDVEGNLAIDLVPNTSLIHPLIQKAMDKVKNSIKKPSEESSSKTEKGKEKEESKEIPFVNHDVKEGSSKEPSNQEKSQTKESSKKIQTSKRSKNAKKRSKSKHKDTRFQKEKQKQQQPQVKANHRREIEIETYQKGITDLENNNYESALDHFLSFINDNFEYEFNSKDIERCISKIIIVLKHLEELKAITQCDAPPAIWENSILQLASDNEWLVVYRLLYGGGNGCETGCGGLASGSDLSSFPLMQFLNWTTATTDKLLNKDLMFRALLENNVNPNGLISTDSSDIKPLVYCLKNNYYNFLVLLVKHGADLRLLSVKDGDTPFHAALQLGFLSKDRSLDLLKMVMQKSPRDSKGYSDLTPNTLDSEDNSLFHLALESRKDDDPLSLEAVRILAEYKVNPYLKNKKGNIPINSLKKNDRRLQYLKMAAKYHQEPKKEKNKIKFLNNYELQTSKEKGDNSMKTTEKNHIETRLHESEIKFTRENMCHLIQQLIDNIPQIIPKRFQEKKVEPFIAPSPEESALSVSSKLSPHTSKDNPEKQYSDTDSTPKPDSNDISEELEQNEENVSMFDDCLWEVECTSKVWKILRDNKILKKNKYQIITKLQTLAKGDWRPDLHKPLSVATKGENIYLFEAKLDKAARILWELAIVFSPKLSETPEKRLQEDDPSVELQVPGGRLYSEIIRVWDIVFDHDNVQKAIDNILKSHNKGQTCIIQKKLKGTERKKFSSGRTSELKVPMIYSELDGIQVEKPQQLFFPPASSHETEYHIMKFYSFSSSLVNHILFSDDEATVDFPFLVTELEHAIINLRPKPPSSILLLGRSGTGKTTCCVYRLWTSFIRYWEKAVQACLSDNQLAVPLIPRNISYQSQMLDSEHEDNELDEEETAENVQQLPHRVEKRLSKKGRGKKFPRKCQKNTESLQPIENKEPTQTDTNEDIFEHLHQIFITKNAVLCSEVKKSFCNLSHGVQAAKYHSEVEDAQLPYRLQDAHPDAFPLFLNARQWLLLLDGSLPQPFFPRNDDGSLKRPIIGWSRDDNHMSFIPLIDDDDEDDEDEEEDDNIEDEFEDGLGVEGVEKKIYDPRKEVTYEAFAYNLWPKINKNEVEYHPTLVWMEITSFIKGSVEALHTKDGFVSEEQYLDLGKRRAPNFTADRKLIYALFKKYQNMKRQASYFDEADLVFNIYNRLKKIDQLDWSIHQFYVDEIQDFTQAELALIIQCSRDPNALFLTGDTAQSIMRGIAFRFADLKSLFYFARENMKAIGKTSSVSVPKKVYQLSHNYRSHTGIVNLATSVLGVLTWCFPDSFDRMGKEQGLFEGPKPVLLESCSFSDLAVLLKGSRRKTSEIEFGAHQVILVANEEAKNTLPPELNLGLVLTIYEAKGLEFDDILLYNFFKDSPAKNEWRIVTSYLLKLIEDDKDKKSIANGGNTNYFELDINESMLSSRPLKFCPEKHKVLNSELKYLYTALTRARVNVWIFDEDEEKRSPMFEYFQAKQLVEVVKPVKDEGGREGLSDGIFTNKSSPAEWNKRGDYFSSHKLWQVAAKCYGKGGDVLKEKVALAHYRALEAQCSGAGHKKHKEFLEASKEFLDCKLYNEAARCLYNSKEYYLAAQLYEKQGKFKLALVIYKKLRKLEDASRCYEQVGDFRAAVDYLCNVDAYDKAIDVFDRYEIMEKDYVAKGKDISRQFSEKKPRHNIENLCLWAAENHLKSGNIKSMLDSLSRVPSPDVQVKFLVDNKKITEAAEILKNGGKQQEAAKLLREHGNLQEALKCNTDSKFRAECLLAYSRCRVVQDKRAISDDEIIDYLNEAVKYFHCVNDPNGEAEAKMLIGFLKKDCKILKEAQPLFIQQQNYSGEIECMDKRLEIGKICLYKHNTLDDDLPSVGEILLTMEHLLCLATTLVSSKQDIKALNLITKCDIYYGLEKSDGNFKAKIHEGPRIMCLNPSMRHDIKPDEAHKEIMQELLLTANRWTEHILAYLGKKRIELKQCPFFIIGKSCRDKDTCQHLHESYQYPNYFQYILSIALEIQLIDILKECEKELKHSKNHLSFIHRMEGFAKVFNQKHKLCQDLYKALLPSHCHPCVLSNNNKAAKQVLGYLRNNHHIINQLKQWSIHQFNPSSTSLLKRVSGTDLFFTEYILHLLIFSNTNKLKNWIGEAETEFTKLAEEKRYKMRIPKIYGIIALPFGSNCQYVSFFKRYFESADQLRTKHNIYMCQSEFNKFFGLPVSRAPLHPLMPSIDTALIMMEHQFTICLATYARLTKRATVALPESYLAQLNFFDFLTFCKTNNAIQNYGLSQKPELLYKQLIGQISFLVKVMSGEKSSHFDILADAFDPENVKYIESGEAERSLILALVMLSNVGRVTPPEHEASLRQQLHLIEIAENMPNRLSVAINMVKEARGISDIVKALDCLLHEKDERLQEYVWRWDPGWKGLYYNPIQYDHFSVYFFNMNFVPKQPDRKLVWQKHENKTIVTQPNPLVHEVDDFTQPEKDVSSTLATEGEEEEEVSKEEEGRLIEEKAASIICRFIWHHYQAYKLRKNKEKVLNHSQLLYYHQPVEPVQSKEEKFWNKYFALIPTFCGVCNVVVKEIKSQKNEKSSFNHENSSKNEIYEENDEDTTPTINMTDVGLDNSVSMDNEIPTFAVHIQSSGHLEKVRNLPSFKSAYLQSLKILQDAKNLIKKMKERKIKSTFSLKKLEIDLEKVRGNQDEVFQKRTWDMPKLYQLQTNAKDLEDSVINTEKEFQQKRQQSIDQAEQPKDSIEDEEARQLEEGMADPEDDDGATTILEFEAPDTTVNKRRKKKNRKRKK